MIFLAQAATIAIPVPVFAAVATIVGGVFGFFVVRYINQIDSKQRECDARAEKHSERLASLESKHTQLSERFNGTRKTDQIMERLVDHFIQSPPSGPTE